MILIMSTLCLLGKHNQGKSEKEKSRQSGLGVSSCLNLAVCVYVNAMPRPYRKNESQNEITL